LLLLLLLLLLLFSTDPVHWCMYMYVGVVVLAQCRSKLAPWVERYDAVTVRTELVDTLKALRTAGADINRYCT
jgi:hypothetical protein